MKLVVVQQAIQTIENWSAKELINFCQYQNVMEQVHVLKIIDRLIEIAEFNEDDFDDFKMENK